jgi:hypothetical protein
MVELRPTSRVTPSRCKRENSVSRLIISALLAPALIAGFMFTPASAQQATSKVQACIGDLCPPESPRDDFPVQAPDGAKLKVQSAQALDSSPAPVKPRKKKIASAESNLQQSEPKTTTTYGVTYDAHFTGQPNWLTGRHDLR